MDMRTLIHANRFQSLTSSLFAWSLKWLCMVYNDQMNQNAYTGQLLFVFVRVMRFLGCSSH